MPSPQPREQARVAFFPPGSAGGASWGLAGVWFFFFFWLVCGAGGGWSDAAKRSTALGNVLLAAPNPEYDTLSLPRSAAGSSTPNPKPGSSAGDPAARAARAKARLRERVNSSQSGWSLSPRAGRKDRFIVAAYLTEVSVNASRPDSFPDLDTKQSVSPWLVPV